MSEHDDINAVADILRKHLDEEFPEGTTMLRDAHPKAHGCVQAEVFVHPEIPNDLRHGVFATPGRMFRAWIRFSNAFGRNPDLKADTRGMAVKLLDVLDARHAAPSSSEARHEQTQDFLAATFDAFFIPNPAAYVDFPEAARRGPLSTMWFFIRRRLGRGMKNLFASMSTLAMNPLAVTYFSQTAYALGGGEAPAAIKFKFEPLITDALGESLPNAVWFAARVRIATVAAVIADVFGMRSAGERVAVLLAPRDFLRHRLARSLMRSDAWFDLRIQRRVGTMSIEDATDRWDEGQSPFQSVAYIRIPRQVFSARDLPDPTWEAAAQAMEHVGEHLSFDPWNGLPEHRPLGGINRARRVAYRSGSEHRHLRNGEPRGEPTVSDHAALEARTRLAPGGEDPRPLPGPVVRSSRWWSAYVRRVPLLTMLLAVGFPLAAVSGPLAPFAHGIFDVRGTALLGVAVLTSLLAFTVLVEWWVITAYGDRRFRTPRAYYIYPIRLRWYGLALVLTLPTAWATWHATRHVWPRDVQDWALMWLGGIGLALVIVWSVRWTADFIGGLPPVKALASYFLRKREAGAGYVDLERRRFLRGQTLALGLFAVTAGIAIMLGALTADEIVPRFGALQFALLFITLASSVLAALTFLFDRFRLPFITSVAFVGLVIGFWFPDTPRFELLRTAEAPKSLLPADVLHAPRVAAGASADRAIVVTASGGGTQSAAWTASVLGGLTRRCRYERCAFDASIALINGTSGGAVGAMHFVDGYVHGQFAGSADELAARASASTHSALWRTLVFVDSLRPLKRLFGKDRHEDRGRALERTWQHGGLGSATVLGWREDARRGERPGLIFNSTIAGTGDLLLISTAGEIRSNVTAPVMRNFVEEYGCREIGGRRECFDLPLVRAARLSSAFPVVTPFARDDAGIRDWRPVDGGYADVYGVEAAVEWLRQALGRPDDAHRRPAHALSDILVVQLRTPQIKNSPFAVSGSSEQDERSRRGLALLCHELKGRMRIDTVTFELPGEPAIAWHLTEDERQHVTRQAQRAVSGPAGDRVVTFLKTPRTDGALQPQTSSCGS